ncbi:uncharacterized protein LOC117107767 [Anneissia japonica]|uniref:uncharacterized protein LOC117107767 n=1 Tax=Anneissia japonica TaxID=1529436 RepID=UPI001425B01D|nr:uncharacterized protein LOC117107767 [Anneissia japonica]
MYVFTCCTEEIFMYLTRRLNLMDENECIDENSLQIYISVLDRLWNVQHQQPGNLVTSCLLKLINGSIPILTRPLNITSQKEVLRFIAISKVLGWLMSSSVSLSAPVNTSILNSIGPIDIFVKCSLKMASFRDTLGTAERGSLISMYLESKWNSLLQLLQRYSSEVYASCNPEDILPACLADLSIMQGAEVMPAMQCVELLLAKVISNPSSCLEALDVCWNVVQDSERGQRVYRACLEAFIKIAFQRDLMKSDSDILTGKLKEIANDFFVAGENKQGLVNLLANQMSESLLALAVDDPHQCVSTALRYLDVLLNFYLFCPSLNKDLR